MKSKDPLAWLSHTIGFMQNKTKDDMPLQLAPDTLLVDLELDSLDIVEIQMYYEEQFKCEIPDPEVAPETVRDLLALLA